MNMPLQINNPVFKIINNSLIDLPAPTNISFMWNFRSLLGLCLMVQIMTSLFLAVHYTHNTEMAFSSVIHICRDMNNGWMMRTIHASGASFFFICLYIHVGSGLYYGSHMYLHTWVSIVMLLTWIGKRPVEEPYIFTGRVLTIMYFSYVIMNIHMTNMWDKMIK